MALPAVMDGVTANAINREHRLANQSADIAIEHAMRCGKLLSAQKKQLKHGQFKPWVKANCEFCYESVLVGRWNSQAHTTSGPVFHVFRPSESEFCRCFQAIGLKAGRPHKRRKILDKLCLCESL